MPPKFTFVNVDALTRFHTTVLSWGGGVHVPGPAPFPPGVHVPGLLHFPPGGACPGVGAVSPWVHVPPEVHVPGLLPSPPGCMSRGRRLFPLGCISPRGCMSQGHCLSPTWAHAPGSAPFPSLDGAAQHLSESGRGKSVRSPLEQRPGLGRPEEVWGTEVCAPGPLLCLLGGWSRATRACAARSGRCFEWQAWCRLAWEGQIEKPTLGKRVTSGAAPWAAHPHCHSPAADRGGSRRALRLPPPGNRAVRGTPQGVRNWGAECGTDSGGGVGSSLG